MPCSADGDEKLAGFCCCTEGLVTVMPCGSLTGGGLTNGGLADGGLADPPSDWGLADGGLTADWGG